MVTHSFMHNKGLKEIFFWPIVLGVITFLGLVFALVEDGGIVEKLSLIGLVIPIGFIIYFYWFKKF
jgi:hypothetical protein